MFKKFIPNITKLISFFVLIIVAGLLFFYLYQTQPSLDEIQIFTNKIPASIYVLLGISLSGLFSLLTGYMSIRSSAKIKELEFEKNKEKLIFDKKLELFTELFIAKSILHHAKKITDSGGEECMNMVSILYKVILLVPEKKENIDDLIQQLICMANHYAHIHSYRESIPPDRKNADKEVVALDKVKEKFSKDLDDLINYLIKNLPVNSGVRS